MDKFFSGQEAVSAVVERKADILLQAQVTLAQALELLQGKEHKVVAHFVHCVRFGYYNEGKFIFADGEELAAKYLVQLRIFNADEELYLQKQGAGYYLQYINDVAGSRAVPTVDSASQLFGHRIAAEVPQGFVELWEAGRKIKIVLPTDKQADEYNLLTRSYVQFDEQTGQAGYAYYRWLDVVPVERRDA